MTADPSKYKTGNAVPSPDARDVYDNSLVFDVIINDPENKSVKTRTGETVLTVTGFKDLTNNLISTSQDRINEVLTSGNENNKGEYSVGVTFNELNDVYVYNDVLYGVTGNATLPYTATEADPSSDSENLMQRGGVTKSGMYAHTSYPWGTGPDGSNIAPPGVLFDFGSGKDRITVYNSTNSPVAMGSSPGVQFNKKNGEVFGVIRQDSKGSGWYFINDSSHTYQGFTDSITVDSNGYISIPVNPGVNKVGTIVTNPDEKLSQYITTGASVTTSEVRVAAYAPLHLKVNAATLDFSVSDFQDPNEITISESNGAITITHPENSILGGPLNLRQISSMDGGRYVISSENAQQTVVREVKDFNIKVTWDGSSWVPTSTLDSVPPINNAGGGFQIVHGFSGVNIPVATAEGAGSYSVVVSGTGTSCFVKFISGDGTPAPAPSVGMSANVTIQRAVYQNQISGRFNLLVGRTKINAENLYGATSNIWISGNLV